ncbi:MAG TPA: WG repeat-containing protein [Xanthobacteraceae bacterium]|nr:WG repeat-containing protein [Xanthobacteraceae bacterium]
MAAPGGAAAADCVSLGDEPHDIGPCTRVDSAGQWWVKAEYLHALTFDEQGIAAVWIRAIQRFHYVGRDGRMAPVITFDNGPDYFVEGLARTPLGGRIGYIDRSLRVVIPPRYDWGSPFEHGRAAVCNGCVPKREGEHVFMEGGLWGLIDRDGREIVPLKYRSAEELPK